MEVEKYLHEVVTHNSPRGECPQGLNRNQHLQPLASSGLTFAPVPVEGRCRRATHSLRLHKLHKGSAALTGCIMAGRHVLQGFPAFPAASAGPRPILAYRDFVGAGLLANAIAHADYRLLKQRVRQQAGSYGVNVGACISPFTGIVQVNDERPRNMSRFHVNPGMI
jgi:hypothetical protein